MLFSDLTWPVIERISKDTPVILPIASVEQHGHHLPLYTDSLLLGEIVSRLETAITDDVLVTPLMWLGNSDHHLEFPGTLSCPPRVYLDLLSGLLDNLITHGFRRLLLLNGHGGNDVPGRQTTYEARQRYRHRSDLLLLFSSYWNLGSEPWQQMPELKQHEMAHAGEWETSMMLRMAPHLVGEYQQTAAVEPGNSFRPAARAWITKDRSEHGHIGWPHLASAEKGEMLLTAFTRDVHQLVERMKQWDGSSWEG